MAEREKEDKERVKDMRARQAEREGSRGDKGT